MRAPGLEFNSVTHERMGASPNQSNASGRVSPVVGAVVVAVVLALLYLVPASTLGFWEPWETSLATLGRHLATTDGVSVFAPMRDDVLVARPWLQTALLSAGYSLGGGTELGFRVPLALLNIFAALFAFVVMSRLFGTVRAACASLLFGATPLVLLSSTSLAGQAVYEAPLVLTIMSLAALVADWERPRPIFAALCWVFLACCLWAGGILGLSLPLSIVALFAIGTQDSQYADTPRAPGLILAALVLGTTVAWPLLQVPSVGWDDTKDWVGVGAALGGPVALLLAVGPRSRLRQAFHRIGTPIGVVFFAAFVGLPMSVLFGATETAHEAVSFLFYQDFLTGRVLPEHVTYDVHIRLVGAAAFPAVIFVPFAFAWVLRTYETRADDTDDQLDGPRYFKLLMALWMGAGFLTFGLGASLAGNYGFPLAFPMVATAALALGDQKFRETLMGDRIVFHLVGLAAFLLLAMTSKDVRGTFDEEMGRPGPHVIFERLLTDGSVDFPATYAFENISIFMLLWTVMIVVAFAAPIDNLRRLGETLGQMLPASATAPTGRMARMGNYVASLVRRALRILSGWLLKLHGVIEPLLRTVRRGASVAVVCAALFTASTVAWAFHLAFIDIPGVTNHLSQKGMMDTFAELSGDPDSLLYVAGINENDNSYYLGEGNIERVPRVAQLRETFCEAEGRAFAVIEFDDLAEAHSSARESREGDGECDAAQPFYVVDGRSTRYVLLSNELHEDAGETDQSAIAENVFTMETLPEGAVVVEEEVLIDGKLRLVATQIDPNPIDRGDLTISAYFEVLEQPTSNYEAFIHIDYGGNRINGDHDPVHGYYPMRNWVVGEIVRDSYTVEVSRADRAGVYDVHYGFFRGDDRLEVVGSASDNRIFLGRVTIE